MHLGEETAKVGCEDLQLNIQQTSGYTMFHLHINFQTVLSVRRGYQISTGWLVQVSRVTLKIYIYIHRYMPLYLVACLKYPWLAE